MSPPTTGGGAASILPGAKRPARARFQRREMQWSGHGVPPCHVPRDVAGDRRPVPDGGFCTMCGAAPGSDGKRSGVGPALGAKSHGAVSPARPCHPHIPAHPCVPAWEPYRVPNRASAIPTRPVCVPTRHATTRDGGDFLALWFVFFFLTKPKYLCPHRDGSGSPELGMLRWGPSGRGDTRLSAEGPRWHPVAPAPRAVPAVYT